jgi:hypothetical protein
MPRPSKRATAVRAVPPTDGVGSLAQLVIATAELRNAGFGTGHGLGRRPELNVATPRLVVAAATFYIEADVASGP